MSPRLLLLTALCVSGLATAKPDGGPHRGTPDAGTKGTTVPDRPSPPPTGAELPAPRTQTTTPVGTGSETPPPVRKTQPPTPVPKSDVPSPTQPPSPTPH